MTKIPGWGIEKTFLVIRKIDRAFTVLKKPEEYT